MWRCKKKNVLPYYSNYTRKRSEWRHVCGSFAYILNLAFQCSASKHFCTKFWLSHLHKHQVFWFFDPLHIPHQKFKSRLATIIRNSFLHKNGNRRYKYLVLGREGPYFVKEHSDAKNKYTEEDIIKMLEFLVDNIFVVFAGKVFQQIVGIPMGTNCTPLLADIFLYSYEAEFIQSLLSAGKKRLASQFNFTYRYIDDVLSFNNPDFENYLGQMYPPW